MNMPSISKADAISAYDGNGAALARALQITPSAVYQWPEGPIDEKWALKLRYVLMPDFFIALEASRDPDADRIVAVEGC
ncbi:MULTISPECIES: hypothetical protein [unclassified Stenotrophomonas]|uniref:hypothetical protein n=1 Tax=unclassified Stenotrophomonas TaxID=196198 RepID=UPI000370F949|nr:MULTISPECIES: hypothetical protein [unclassified Stenotrophomonas]PKH74939.1 hypothetical protein CXF90_03945 [Stenotrophomonas sp. Betaine-02u-23]PKH95887.1 hypothetical protein CXG43_11730 [Stenotrophomonas sp. Bg11-02]